ncbi:F-box DNA helicase 1-like [Argonauta hians]
MMLRRRFKKPRSNEYLCDPLPSTSQHLPNRAPVEIVSQCVVPDNNLGQKSYIDLDNVLETTEEQNNFVYTENPMDKQLESFSGFTKASELICIDVEPQLNKESSNESGVLNVTSDRMVSVSEGNISKHALKIRDSCIGMSKILMTTDQCFEYQNTKEGSKALVDPFSVQNKTGNINKVLEPRKRIRKKKNLQIENQSNILQFFQRSPKKNVSPPENPISIESDLSICSADVDNNSCSSVSSSHQESVFNKIPKDHKYVDFSIAKNHKSVKVSNLRKRKKTFSQMKTTTETIFIDSDDNDEDINSYISSCDLAEKHYGLFGDSCDEILEKVNFFERLPNELKRIIFCQLPARDLFFNCPQVCTDWNQLINNTKFMSSKLLYYKVRKDPIVQQDKFREQLYRNGFMEPVSLLPHFICYMKQQSFYKDVLPYLNQHPCYEKALYLMKTQFQDCIVNEKPSVCCMVSLMFILCKSVKDCQLLLKNLFSSDYGALDIILDNVYNIALHFFGMMSVAGPSIWNVIHYRLLYSLYLYENASHITIADMNIPSIDKQQTIVRYCDTVNKLRLTNEQLQIVNHNVKPGEIVNIIAFAGTGKSSTLVRYAQTRPGTRFLLIVYNKSVCEHAKTIFPPNVHCMTGHGLAFKKKGIRYAMNQKLHPGNPKVRDIAANLERVEKQSHTLRARMVLFFLEKFLASKDPEITMNHISDFMKTSTYRKTFGGNVDPAACLKDARNYWNKMIDINDKTVKITHDGYLKLFQLSKPQLGSYDVILVDEAQDLTPAITDILLSQPQAKILVGDPNQQIYAFRGAINAMQNIEANRIFYLTQSFRFGPEIAFVANCFLYRYGRSTEVLVGGTKKSTIKGESIGQVAYIARCNFTLFAEAVKLGYNKTPRIKMAFVGGTAGFGFNVLRDIHCLILGGSASQEHGRKPSFITRFSSFSALKRYAEHACDSELMGQIKIAHTYAMHLPDILNFFQESEMKDIQNAEVIFATAHKSKGLEFDTVKILEDFNLETRDERNLFYVAITRAKYSLYLTDFLCNLIDEFSVSIQVLYQTFNIRVPHRCGLDSSTRGGFPSHVPLSGLAVFFSGWMPFLVPTT